jgi:hypothetical protein
MGDKPAKSLGDVVAHVKPRIATVRLYLDGDVVREHERLKDQLQQVIKSDANSNEPDEAPAIARRIKDLEDEMREGETEFVFQAIGKPKWSDLLAQHPPTKEQREQGLDHNPEKFPAVAIAASLIDPGDADLEAVEALGASLSIGQWSTLWVTCLKANVGGEGPGESLAASAVLRASEQSSTSAADAASLAASSSDES